jgi:protein gp37
VSAGTSIEWAHHTFNPWWGCVEAGPECDRCYARAFAHRLGQDLWGAAAPRRPASENYWRQPIGWDLRAAAAGERHRVFCASMADVLEDRRDLDASRTRLWELMEATPNLDWLLLSKRPSKFATLTPERWREKGWPSNVWAGTSAGTQRTADVLVPQLLEAAAGATVRFVSAEPLLEAVVYTRWLVPDYRSCQQRDSPAVAALARAAACRIGWRGVDWVIAGAESGYSARPMDPPWVRSVRDQCQAAGVPFFFKQDADQGRKRSTPEIDGRRWVEVPRG